LSLIPLVKKIEGLVNIFSNPAFETISHEKVPPLGHAFSDGQDNKPDFKFHTNRGMLPIYRMILKIEGFSRFFFGRIANFEEAFEFIAV
jgi:hypothetical protein